MPISFRLLLASLTLLQHGFAVDSWPQFRGPRQDGLSDAKDTPVTWSENEHVKWKVALPGEGWSSPIVGNKQIWLTTALDGGKSLHAVCVDFASGKIVQDVEVFKNDSPPPKHERNSYASPTGIIDGDKVFVHFGAMGTACLDAPTGSVRWENRDLKVDHQNGPGGSLAQFHDKLLIACDGMDAQYGVALDKENGHVVWKTERSAIPILAKLPQDMRKAYGTPYVITVDGHAQCITTGSNRLYSYDPANGRELWYVDYSPGFSNVPTPVGDGKTLVTSTGFMKAQLWAIRLVGAKGNATASNVAWKQAAGAPDQTSPIIVNGRVYMVSSGGILSCLDLADGHIIWKERIGSDFAASPLLAGGNLYFFAAAGPCTVIKPGDTFQKLASNELEAGCMASPAVVEKALIVRTKTHLYRIEN
jgi:outer membrane protein assembly factor BamB